MKYCEECGCQLKDEAKFCGGCGTVCETIESQKEVHLCKACGAQLDPEDLFCSQCGSSNNTDQEETPADVCQMCGTPLKEGAKFCFECGVACVEAETKKAGSFCGYCGAPIPSGVAVCPGCGKPLVSENNSMPPEPGRKNAEETVSAVDDENEETTIKANYIGMICTGIAMILWFAAPFLAVNLLTLGDQPTAFQLVCHDVTVIGELMETSAFWAALVSAIGIIMCFVGSLASEQKTTRIVAMVTEVPLLVSLLEMASWAYDLEEFFECFGIGFWGIAVLLLVIAYLNKNSKQSEDTAEA